MKLMLSLLLTMSIIVFGTMGVARADTTITQVTSNSYEDSLPQIKGDYLVWQGFSQI